MPCFRKRKGNFKRRTQPTQNKSQCFTSASGSECVLNGKRVATRERKEDTKFRSAFEALGLAPVLKRSTIGESLGQNGLSKLFFFFFFFFLSQLTSSVLTLLHQDTLANISAWATAERNCEERVGDLRRLEFPISGFVNSQMDSFDCANLN